MEFVPFKEFPKFIDVDKEEDKKDDGNYYTVISRAEKEQEEIKNRISRGMSKVGMVRKNLRTKGIKDKDKKELLVNIIKEAEND